MTRVVVLGGGGGIGTVASRTVAATGDFDEIVVADVREDAARRVASELGPVARAASVDAASPASLAALLTGADVAVNCVGPFYRFGAPILAAAIDAGVAYVDVCDDLDATERQLALDDDAKRRGVCAVIGLGNSPGLANLLARFAADELLDTCRAVDIMHIHGGEPDEGAAVIQHRIHAMVHDVPVFVDGRFETVRLLEDSGARFVEETDFRDVGRFPVYPYPHPETITLPRHLRGLERATNRGVVFPLAYFERTMEIVRRGLAAAGAVPPEDLPVDRWTEEILSERPRLLAEAGVTGPGGCLKIVARGEKDGAEHTYVFSVSSASEGAGAGTGIPAGIGAALLARGLSVPGVHPPEAVIAPLAALAIAADVVPKLGVSGSGGGALPIHIEHIGPNGSEELPLDVF